MLNSIRNVKFIKMRELTMFITAVCVLFLIKLRWPKNKSLFETVKKCSRNCSLLEFNRCSFVVDRQVMSRFLLPVLKATTCLRINRIPKIMDYFCYLRLYLDFETVSCRLLQQVAKMDMDWNLEKLGQLFQVLIMLCLQKIKNQNIIMVGSPW